MGVPYICSVAPEGENLTNRIPATGLMLQICVSSARDSDSAEIGQAAKTPEKKVTNYLRSEGHIVFSN